MKAICEDLHAEYQALAAFVQNFSPDQWSEPTAFYGWTAWDEIAHLSLFDELALVAVGSIPRFREQQARLEARLAQGVEISQIAREHYAGLDGAALTAHWSQTSAALVGQLACKQPKERLPWFGPDMSARSFATARLMETWAHGQDIFDVRRTQRPASARLLHIAHLGVVTFQWSYRVHGQVPPAEAPRVVLEGPAGAVWQWNDTSSHGAVRGPARDFCLVVTQRRHVADTQLHLEGPVAEAWMSLAQCFAGPPAQGPAAGMHAPRPETDRPMRARV